MNKEITLDETINVQMEPAISEAGCIAGDVFISIVTLVVVIGVIALFKSVGMGNGR